MELSRKTVHLGDDRFAIDPDMKVFRNGYGLVPKREHLVYIENEEKKKIHRDSLWAFLFLHELEPKEAVRRTKIAMGWRKLSKSEKSNRLQPVINSRKKQVYCVTRRRKFKSMTHAAKEYGFSRPSLFQAMEENRAIKGLKFKFI